MISTVPTTLHMKVFHSLALGSSWISIVTGTLEFHFSDREMKTRCLLWIILHAVLVGAQILAVESITIASGLSTARYCVTWCAISHFGCSINSCYCAPYLRSTNDSDISYCVTGSCLDNSDVEAATSAISSYCDNYYSAVDSTPTAVRTSAIQDTTINGELD